MLGRVENTKTSLKNKKALVLGDYIFFNVNTQPSNPQCRMGNNCQMLMMQKRWARRSQQGGKKICLWKRLSDVGSIWSGPWRLSEVSKGRQVRQRCTGAFSSGFHLLQFILHNSDHVNHHQECQLDKLTKYNEWIHRVTENTCSPMRQVIFFHLSVVLPGIQTWEQHKESTKTKH